MDTIFINELRIETRIGIYAWEQQVAQTIQLDLEIGLRGMHAAQSDRIEDTIDYATVVNEIKKLFEQQHFSLLELCMARASRAQQTSPAGGAMDCKTHP